MFINLVPHPSLWLDNIQPSSDMCMSSTLIIAVSLYLKVRFLD